MLKHIVMWKFKDAEGKTKDEKKERARLKGKKRKGKKRKKKRTVVLTSRKV